MDEAPDARPRRRAREADRRSQQLAERLDRLRSGEPSTAADVAIAEQAVLDSQQHDREAHEAAARAHRAAARAHLSAADVADRAGEHERAAQHRAAAQLDEDAAHRDEQGPTA